MTKHTVCVKVRKDKIMLIVSNHEGKIWEPSHRYYKISSEWTNEPSEGDMSLTFRRDLKLLKKKNVISSKEWKFLRFVFHDRIQWPLHLTPFSLKKKSWFFLFFFYLYFTLYSLFYAIEQLYIIISFIVVILSSQTLQFSSLSTGTGGKREWQSVSSHVQS